MQTNLAKPEIYSLEWRNTASKEDLIASLSRKDCSYKESLSIGVQLSTKYGIGLDEITNKPKRPYPKWLHEKFLNEAPFDQLRKAYEHCPNEESKDLVMQRVFAKIEEEKKYKPVKAPTKKRKVPQRATASIKLQDGFEPKLRPLSDKKIKFRKKSDVYMGDNVDKCLFKVVINFFTEEYSNGNKNKEVWYGSTDFYDEKKYFIRNHALNSHQGVIKERFWKSSELQTQNVADAKKLYDSDMENFYKNLKIGGFHLNGVFRQINMVENMIVEGNIFSARIYFTPIQEEGGVGIEIWRWDYKGEEV